jgi:hypothetical protein
MEGTAVKKMAQKKKTLQQKGTKSEENMFRSFMEIAKGLRNRLTRLNLHEPGDDDD